ncbi:putative ABC transport system permease protein [Paenibacillus catalpae]|uniref:Putative ABC transport system permease protein n=1 Tax=Paenibacillus catalpae TaxID=1045775 RepID=A0A1I2GPC5_9BACL|nr:ABC transporter permease [Paenibacillus catalpae]SFF19794.1 putative ABC transport system permease protein [Paenibacillus catalpae]
MSLFDLTIRNVKRNFRLYSIYLLSMIIGVIIQYTFSSLMYNQDIVDALQNRELFQTGIAIASVVIFLFIIFFILYANSFFMRQRKKEFGMYLLYGLNERQIVRMVFYETLIMGLISLVVGILLGGLLSKLFGMLLMNLMQYDQVISLSFPIGSIATAAAVILLIALIVSVQSYILVNRVQLTELFHAKQKAEKPVRISTAMAILAVLLIGVAFSLICSGQQSAVWQDYGTYSLIATAIGIVGGTYLFFRQFAGWLLQLISRGKKYHEGNTVLWTSSLRFQIRGNTLNLTFISLFSAVIMMLLCFVTINYKVQFEAVGRNVPNAIAYESLDPATNQQIDGVIKSSKHDIRYHLKPEALVVEPVTDRGIAFDNPEYYIPGLWLVSEKSYNELIQLRGDMQQVELQGMEAVTLSQGSDFPKHFAAGESPDFAVKAAGEEKTFKIAEKKDYAYLGWATDPVLAMGKKPPMFVISDEAYAELSGLAEKKSFEIYGLTDAKNAEELSKQVSGIVSKTKGTYYSSFADVYSKQIESSSLLLFAAGFLALIATFALASVIYFKQLREATEERQQYAILRKIGAENRQFRSVIRKQLLFVFLPPIVLGLLYSWTIIKYYILESVKDFPELPGIVWSIMGVFFLIYLVFYASSANLYYRIINKNP